MSAFLHKFDSSLEKLLSEKNKFTDLLDIVEKKTNVKRIYVVKILLTFFSAYMIFGHFAALVCNFVGFVYPAYRSIHALESQNKDDDTKWLTYWVVFSTYSVVDFFADSIFSWFPIYWLCKIVFLIWCFLPITSNGSAFVYGRVIRPFFLKNKAHVDNFANRIVDEASKLANKQE